MLAPSLRLKLSSAQFLLGTDCYGRDVLSRIIYGSRISLLIGVAPPCSPSASGFWSACVRFFRWVDAVMMRVMDYLMAMPSILLAIAVVSLSGASVMTMIAITIPEIPRGGWCARSCYPRVRSRMRPRSGRLQPAENHVAHLMPTRSHH